MQDLFDRIKSIRDKGQLSENDIEKMVVRIVETLKEQHITYDQAYEILRATNQTLEEMSKAVEL